MRGMWGIGLAVIATSAMWGDALMAQAARPVGAELSPGMAWFPHGPDTRPVGVRRLSPADEVLAKRRADAWYAAIAATESFRTPRDRAHLVTSTAAIERPPSIMRSRAPVLQQDVTLYWSVPTSVRRLPTGILAPKLGGAHELLYVEINRVPRADQLEDRARYGDFSRRIVDRAYGGYFAMPATFGTLGGGVVYADVITFTRDGSSVLAPAPLGVLLDLEIARYEEIVTLNAKMTADRLAEAEASMSPARVAERRANREEVWRRETPDPAVLARRLAAAHVSDSLDALETKRAARLPERPDPQDVQWGPKLALEAVRTLAASLDAAGRAQPACARKDPAFRSSLAVRFVAVGSTPDCVPMMQVRDDLLDATRPVTEVQLVQVHSRGSQCGAVLAGAVASNGGLCDYAIPVLRAIDWRAVRQAVGWDR